MSLTAWLGYGWLTEHQPTSGGIRDLFALIERDLADCEHPELLVLRPHLLRKLGF